jgi:hypothetical protein
LANAGGDTTTTLDNRPKVINWIGV